MVEGTVDRATGNSPPSEIARIRPAVDIQLTQEQAALAMFQACIQTFNHLMTMLSNLMNVHHDAEGPGPELPVDAERGQTADHGGR
jgi:hypothetical protein